jgi:FkbM family methyltransferase
MKKQIMWAIKRAANRAGYDIKYYHPYYDALLKNYGIKTVIDIGANDGQFATDLHRRAPEAKIYSFEPLQDAFRSLCKNMSDVKNFTAFNFALGDASGKTEINRSSFSPSSSLLSMSSLHKKLYPKSAGSVKEQITVKRLDDMNNEIKIVGGLLIKMDVQGYEGKVIDGGKQMLKKAEVVIAETSFVSLYENQPLFADIHDLMKSLGFSYRGNTEKHWNNATGEPMYENSVFIKEK